ncbi:cell division protein FtsK [Pseudonocardia humida]|uniref:Cell division protein FtsK n=1 Tax=Pseudonocardia humida TaxID=2800819 RepID=A0ABT1A3H9_9PSEU|nr:cell division protein FtsK [Pseudonocardia humida]MCO1657364.1 cell division protein FtsK [Pseudonocardia humida]
MGVARRAVAHERTVTSVRWLARNLVLYVLAGARILVRRLWEARTNSRYERLMRSAETVGDYERLTEWEARAEQARERRHRRRMEWLLAPVAVVHAVVVTIVTTAGLLLGLGAVLAIGYADFSWLLAPLRTAVDLIAWVVWLLGVVWLPVVLAVPWVVLAGLWEVGRRSGAVPAWAAPGGSRVHETVIVTPGGIATALAHLGIPALNRAVKEGWQVEFATPPVRVNRRGYQSTFSLPMGVTPEMIADKRDVLARNLVRAPLEVWPTAAERAGYVDLWVADQGSTEKPAPPYPLLHEGTADLFAGIPLGVSQRGDVIAPPLPGGNVAFGGVMGQGKSNAARVVMAGAALDPLAELWVFVFANNGDFDAYRPRLARYHRGVDDATVVAALESLRALYEEVGRREARLAALGAKKVTRPLAEKHPDLRPVVALFSECHELFGHGEHGKEAADLAVQTMRRARKTAISLAFDTQSSRADAIPPKIVELVKINACFAVKSWRSNDGFLGDGSFQAGIRATELRMGKDVGTSVLTGATDERFEIVKWFYIEVDDDTGYDAAADIIARAMSAVHPAVKAQTGAAEQDDESRDLLDDLGSVLGNERVPAADVPALLRDLAPNWLPYRRLNGMRLRQVLEKQYGIKVPSTGNRYPIDPAAVRSRLAERDG